MRNRHRARTGTPRFPSPRVLSRFLLLSLLVQCGVIDDPSPVYMVTVISGNGQHGLQGELLPEPVSVRVTQESSAEPLAGARLLITGDGELPGGESVDTDEFGEAVLQWRLGSEYRQQLAVRLADHPESTASVTAIAGYAYRKPAETDDGWNTDTLAMDEERRLRLAMGIDLIRNETLKEIHSLLIVHGSRLVLEEYFPGHNSSGQLITFGPGTPHEVQSASKSLRSLILGIAIDKGFIEGVDEPLFSYFPEYAHLNGPGKQEITLEHVLTMSTGLRWNENGPGTNNLSVMYSRPYADWAAYVLEQPLAYVPGTRFVYNTGTSLLINRIIINATGMPLDEFVRVHYSDPIQSELLPGAGNPLGAATLPRDFAKMGSLMLHRGMWKDTRIVSETWVESSIKKAFPTEAGVHYGYQWWIRELQANDRTYEAICAIGNGGQFVIVVRDLDLVIVSTGGNFDSLRMWDILSVIEAYILTVFKT